MGAPYSRSSVRLAVCLHAGAASICSLCSLSARPPGYYAVLPCTMVLGEGAKTRLRLPHILKVNGAVRRGLLGDREGGSVVLLGR